MAGYTGDYLAAAAAAVQRNAMPKPYPPYGPWEYPSLEYNPYMPEMYAYEQALIPSALAQAFALPFCDFQLLNPDPNMFSMQQQQMLQNLQNAQQGLRPPMPQGFQSTMPNPMGSGLQPTIQQSMPGMRFMPGAMPADSPFTSNPSSNGLASSSAPPKPATDPEPVSIPPVPAMPQSTMSGAFPTPQAAAPPPPMLSLPPGYPSGYPYPGQSQLPFFRDPTLGLPPGVPSPYAFPPQPGPFPQGIDYSNMNMPKPADQSTKHNCNDDDDGGDELTARALKRPRLVWTPQLHKKFEESVHKLGVDKAVPKTIMQLMNIEGLTRENVASHLQKYRLHLKKQEQSEEKEQPDEHKSAPSSPSKQ